MEPSAVACHAVGRLQQKDAKWRHEAKVAVLGLGTIGLLIFQWLNIREYRNAICTGHHEGQKKFFRETTGTGLILSLQRTYRILSVLYRSIQMIREKILSLTVSKAVVHWQILRKQIHMTGTWNSSFDREAESDDWIETLSVCGEGKHHPEWLISHRFSFDELPKGLDVMWDKEQYHAKVMIGESK